MNGLLRIIFGGIPVYLTSGFGWRTLRGAANYHNGADYGTNGRNLPLHAIGAGTVYSKGYNASGAGYYIWIEYRSLGVRMCYYHLEAATTLSVGQPVTRGTLVGYTGTTGNSTGIHLHLGILNLATNTYVDPVAYGQNFTGAYPVSTGIVGTPVPRDNSVPQVEITIGNLRARRRAEYSDELIAGFIAPGFYNVEQEVDRLYEDSNGFYWYKIGEGLFVARGSRYDEKDLYTQYYAAETAGTGETAQLRAQIEQLEALVLLYQGVVTDVQAAVGRVERIRKQ